MRFVPVLCLACVSVLAALLAASPAEAQCRNGQVVIAPAAPLQIVRPAFVQSAFVQPVTYQAPVYHAQALQVVKLQVAPDYYFSVRDYYRDAVQLEILRELNKLRQPVVQAPAGTPPGSLPLSLPAGKGEGIDPALVAVVNQSCLKCHGGEQGSKGNFNMADLTKLSADDWMESYDRVKRGDMPRNANPLPDGEAGLFFAQARKMVRKK